MQVLLLSGTTPHLPSTVTKDARPDTPLGFATTITWAPDSGHADSNGTTITGDFRYSHVEQQAKGGGRSLTVSQGRFIYYRADAGQSICLGDVLSRLHEPDDFSDDRSARRFRSLVFLCARDEYKEVERLVYLLEADREFRATLAGVLVFLRQARISITDSTSVALLLEYTVLSATLGQLVRGPSLRTQLVHASMLAKGPLTLTSRALLSMHATWAGGIWLTRLLHALETAVHDDPTASMEPACFVRRSFLYPLARRMGLARWDRERSLTVRELLFV